MYLRIIPNVRWVTKKYQKSKISIHCSNHDQQSDRRASQCAEQPLRFQKYVFILVVVRTWSGVGPELVRTSKLTHFSILATSLTLDLEGVEFNPGNLVCRCYFLADSDTHIDCGSMDFFSADNPSVNCIFEDLIVKVWRSANTGANSTVGHFSPSDAIECRERKLQKK